MYKSLIIFTLAATLSSCGLVETRPKLEMSLAAAAFIAAKRAQAATLAPTLYRRAEVLYIKAKSAYKRKYFNKAKQYAKASRKYSEEAEFKAIKKAAFESPDDE